MLSTPLLRIAVQNPNFCPCRASLSTLFFLFSSSSAAYGVASRPALCPLSFFASFPLQARSLFPRRFIPHAPFHLRACNRPTHFADFCRFEACFLSPFRCDTRRSLTQFLDSRALQTSTFVGKAELSLSIDSCRAITIQYLYAFCCKPILPALIESHA